MFLEIKSALERVDHYRDRLLSFVIKKYWPRFILPNHLTLLRIIIALAITTMLFTGFYEKTWIVPLLIMGALTDLFDGSIARLLNKITNLGTVLDPIADRLLILPIAIFSLLNHYLWLLIVLLIPELYNAFFALYYKTKEVNIKANIFGKTKMVFYCVSFIYIFIFNFPEKPAFFTIVLLHIALLFLFIDLVFKTKTTLKYAKTL